MKSILIVPSPSRTLPAKRSRTTACWLAERVFAGAACSGVSATGILHSLVLHIFFFLLLGELITNNLIKISHSLMF